MMSQTDKMAPLTLIQSIIILRKPGVANFADIIKTTITLIKRTFRKSKLVKRITNYASKCIFFSLSSNFLLICGEKC